jgi:hypothetical protein
MKKVSRLVPAAAVGLMLAGSLAAVAADAPAPAPPKPQVSAAAGKDLQAAQKALSAQPPNYDEVLADLEKVKNNPKKNEYDEYVMNEFYISLYAGQKKLQEATAPLEAVMASKFIPADELKRRVVQAAYVYYQLQNYDKTIELGNRAIKEGSGTDQLELAVAQAYYLKNDFKGADAFTRGIVEDQIKAGQAPSAEILEIGLSAEAKQTDEAGESRWLELMVTYHPKPEYWEDLLSTMYHNKLTDAQNLQLYRLSAEVGTLKRGSDYAEMAQLALDAGSPGEAVTTLTNAFAANAFTDTAEKNRNQHLLDSAKKQAASDQPTLAKTEASAGNAATGNALVGVGIGYFGYGDYPKAVKDISDGLAKGMSRDSSDARILLGIAQLKTGDKDGAVKTFKAVKGDPVYERLAALWVLRAKT